MQFGEVTEVDLNIPTGTPNVLKVTTVHQGPVRALLRSPFFENVLLSVGIWTFALWRDGIEVSCYCHFGHFSDFGIGIYS